MNDDCELKKTRHNLVAKDNRMIQKSRMSLTLVENKAILYLISKIQPTDTEGQIYTFNCSEFQALLNWSKEASYANIKIMLKNIGDASWWIEIDEDGRKSDALVRWFDIVHMDRGTGNIDISFHRDMFPFLLDLKKRLKDSRQYYTSYQLQNVALMRHKYSPRIYELLKSYQYNNKKWTFEIGTGSEYDIQYRIADTAKDKKTGKPIARIPKSWKNWAIFRRDVLDPAIAEINKYTDIKVQYKGKKEDIHHRKTRAVHTIEVYMVSKTGTEQRETNDIIDAEYNVVSDEREMSREEEFFAAHEKSLKRELEENAYFEALRAEKEAEKSKHPILYDELNGHAREAKFTDDQINYLYDVAIKDRVVGEIPIGKWELYATDVVTYYYDKILSTPDETKTTIYRRLCDCVKNDYDNVASNFLEIYR